MFIVPASAGGGKNYLLSRIAINSVSSKILGSAFFSLTEETSKTLEEIYPYAANATIISRSNFHKHQFLENSFNELLQKLIAMNVASEAALGVLESNSSFFHINDTVCEASNLGVASPGFYVAEKLENDVFIFGKIVLILASGEKVDSEAIIASHLKKNPELIKSIWFKEGWIDCRALVRGYKLPHPVIYIYEGISEYPDEYLVPSAPGEASLSQGTEEKIARITMLLSEINQDVANLISDLGAEDDEQTELHNNILKMSSRLDTIMVNIPKAIINGLITAFIKLATSDDFGERLTPKMKSNLKAVSDENAELAKALLVERQKMKLLNTVYGKQPDRGQGRRNVAFVATDGSTVIPNRSPMIAILKAPISGAFFDSFLPLAFVSTGRRDSSLPGGISGGSVHLLSVSTLNESFFTYPLGSFLPSDQKLWEPLLSGSVYHNGTQSRLGHNVCFTSRKTDRKIKHLLVARINLSMSEDSIIRGFLADNWSLNLENQGGEDSFIDIIFGSLSDDYVFIKVNGIVIASFLKADFNNMFVMKQRIEGFAAGDDGIAIFEEVLNTGAFLNAFMASIKSKT